MDQVVAEFGDAARRGVEAGFDLRRAARGARLPAVLVPVADLQPAHRRVRRLAREPAAVPARGLRRGARRRAGRTSRSRSASRRPTGCPTATPSTTPSRSRGPSSPTAPAAIDVSSGQVTQGREAGLRTVLPDAVRRPDPSRGRRPAGVAVIAVGAISSHDDVNSILLAGRADLCALGRTHLYDPMWTLHAAAEQDYGGPAAEWPLPVAGRSPPAAHGAHRQDPAAAVAPARRPRTTSTCAGARPPASRPRRPQPIRRRPRVRVTPRRRRDRGRHRAAGRVDGHRRRRPPPQHGDPAGRVGRGRPDAGARAGRLLRRRAAGPPRGRLRGSAVVRPGGHRDGLGGRASARPR